MEAAIDLLSGETASVVPATFFKLRSARSLDQILSENHDIAEKKDETIGGTECRVICAKSKNRGMEVVETLWIGKADQLIYKVVRVIAGYDSSAYPQTLMTNKAFQDSMARLHGTPITFTEIHENISTGDHFEKQDFLYKPTDEPQ